MVIRAGCYSQREAGEGRRGGGNTGKTDAWRSGAAMDMGCRDGSQQTGEVRLNTHRMKNGIECHGRRTRAGRSVGWRLGSTVEGRGIGNGRSAGDLRRQPQKGDNQPEKVFIRQRIAGKYP